MRGLVRTRNRQCRTPENADGVRRIGTMIARSACPDCNQAHTILAPPAGRFVVRCSHCRRLWPPAVSAETEVGAERCNEHPGRKTKWVCEQCDRAWCQPCSRRVRTPGFQTKLSPCCNDGLVPVADVQVIRPFWTELPAVMLYALRGGSPFVLLFLFFGGFVPIFSLTIPIFAAGYGVHVTRCSSSDPYSAPGFPGHNDILDDFLFPLLRLLGASLVAWYPWLLYAQFGPETPNPIVRGLFLVLGLSIYPAIVLNTTIQNRLFRALVPTELWRTIRWMGLDYLAVIAALGIFVLAWKASGQIAAENDALGLLMRYTRFYLLVTMFHVFGRSVWQTRHRIDWGV